MSKIPLWAKILLVISVVGLGILSKPLLNKTQSQTFVETFLNFYMAGDNYAALDQYLNPEEALTLETILNYKILSQKEISPQEFTYEVEIDTADSFFKQHRVWELKIQKEYNQWKVVYLRPID